jgi:hypothetical protein
LFSVYGDSAALIGNFLENPQIKRRKVLRLYGIRRIFFAAGLKAAVLAFQICILHSDSLVEIIIFLGMQFFGWFRRYSISYNPAY